MAKLEEFIRNKLINVYSKRLVEEMRTFVWNNGRPEAMRSCNDDLIMALAIACWVRDTALVKSSRDVAFKKAMIGSIGSSRVTLNTTIPGMADHRKSHEMFEKKRKAVKENEEFMWLYKG